MKDKVKQPQEDVFEIIKDTSAKKLLAPILSPMENAVLRHVGKPFTFTFEGASVYISGRNCKKLLHTITYKAGLFNAMLAQERDRKDIPYKLREVLDDPAVILSLHPILRNRLSRLECYTMFALVSKGRDYFIKEKNFGKPAMKTLDELFAKHKAGHLFI